MKTFVIYAIPQEWDNENGQWPWGFPTMGEAIRQCAETMTDHEHMHLVEVIKTVHKNGNTTATVGWDYEDSPFYHITEVKIED